MTGISTGLELRAIVRKLRLPAALLSFVAVIPYVNAPGAPAAAASAPQAAAAPAPAPAAAPALAATAAPAAQATPAVTRAVATPATTLFARGVPGLSPQVLSMALDAVACARARGVSGKENLLTVIDYSLPSTEPRLWVLDLERGEVLYHELVAHGAGTGEKYATRFSNTPDSRQTSLGLFLTGGTYIGGNGYSLKLKGLDKGVNDRAEERYIVMHGAWYVSEEHARRQGRIGRSWGCPALSEAIAPEVIDTIKGGSFVFSYSSTDKSWVRTASASLNSCAAGSEDPNATVLAVR